MQWKLFLSFLICTVAFTGVDSSFVDPNIVLQENFQGWGTSLAWWADMVGGMEEEIFDHVIDTLFSPTKLNLNIARYVIGGTTPDNYTCGEYRDGAATESFRDGLDSPYNWDRDLRQRKVLLAAKSKGANLFEAFSNTPPQWMTIAECSKGNPRSPPLHSNFDPSNSQLFADYATEVIKYFHDQLNITFSTYSPFNEPFGLHGIGSWAGSIQSQEGCNMNRPTMVSVIESVAEAITSKNLTFLKIAVSDETQVNTQIQSYDFFTDAGVAGLFSQVNVHGYWDNIELSRKDLLSLKCTKAGHELWMDEMGWGGTPANNMEQALNIATRVILDLRKMLPSAWVYWQAVEGGGGWGLVEVPYVNTTLENIVINSGYYGLEQFSQHIKQGYQLIFISDENSVAALSPEKDKLVIVFVNPTNAEIAQELNLSLFSSLGAPTLFRTSTTEQHLNLPPPSIIPGNKVNINLPPESISTLEFSGVQFSNQPNLLENGDFESVSETETGALVPTSWETLGGGEVTEETSWRGEYSGVLQVRVAILFQNVVLPENSSSCDLYLSAWCATTASRTYLGAVLINDDSVKAGPEVQIVRNSGYSMYSFSFSANSSDIVVVQFIDKGSPLSGTAKIDNIFLHANCV